MIPPLGSCLCVRADGPWKSQGIKTREYKSLSKLSEGSDTVESRPQLLWNLNREVLELTVLAPTIHFLQVRTLCSWIASRERKHRRQQQDDSIVTWHLEGPSKDYTEKDVSGTSG